MSIFQLSNSFQKIVIYIAPNASFFSLKCTKIVGGWGSAPDPAGGAYSAPPDPLAVMGWDGNLGKFRPPPNELPRSATARIPSPPPIPAAR